LFNLVVDWPIYLAPWLDRFVPGTAQELMYVVGAIEIAAGVVVALAPRFGALLVAGWLAGIVVNLLTADPPRFYDIALRDVGLMLGALALARLAAGVDARRARTLNRPLPPLDRRARDESLAEPVGPNLIVNVPRRTSDAEQAGRPTCDLEPRRPDS
jgi:hypothetical protein